MGFRSNQIFADGKSVTDFASMPSDFGDAYTSTAVTASRLDLGRIVRMDSGSANTYTIPPNGTFGTSSWFDEGEYIILSQEGAGLTTMVAGTGVTIQSLAGLTSLGQYAYFGVQKQPGANIWRAFGSLTV